MSFDGCKYGIRDVKPAAEVTLETCGGAIASGDGPFSFVMVPVGSLEAMVRFVL